MLHFRLNLACIFRRKTDMTHVQRFRERKFSIAHMDYVTEVQGLKGLGAHHRQLHPGTL